MRNWNMSFYDKPFYIEVGTCLVAIRGTATNDVIYFFDHHKHGKGMIEFAQDLCELMNENCEKFNASTSKKSLQVGDTAKMREALLEVKRILKYLYRPELAPTDGDNRHILKAEKIIDEAKGETK